MVLIIITVPKFTFEWLFPLKIFLKSLIQGEGTSDPEAGGWGRHCWCEHFFCSSDNVLENPQPWLLKGWILWVVWMVGVWKWGWGALCGPWRPVWKPVLPRWLMVTELGALDSMFISATIYLGQGLVPSVLMAVNCKGSSTVLGMSEMDVYSLY